VCNARERMETRRRRIVAKTRAEVDAANIRRGRAGQAVGHSVESHWCRALSSVCASVRFPHHFIRNTKGSSHEGHGEGNYAEHGRRCRRRRGHFEADLFFVVAVAVSSIICVFMGARG